MEKETLISELTTRLGETPLSERTISNYAARVLSSVPAEGEIPQTFWDFHIGTLHDIEGQLRHETKLHFEKLEADWKKSHPDTLQPPTPPTPPTPPAGGQNQDMEAMMEKIMGKFNSGYKEQIDAMEKSLKDYTSTVAKLQEKLDAKEKEEAEKGMKNSLIQSFKNLGEVNDAVLDLTLSQLTYDGKMTPEQMFEAAKGIYGKEYKRFFGDGAVPFKGSNDKAGDSFVDRYIQKVKDNQAKEAERKEAMRKSLR